MRAFVGHFEIPAAEPERCARFLRRAFGWRVETVAWEEGAYFKIRTPRGEPAEAIQGGVADGAAAGLGAPLPVVHIEEGSIEQALARVVEAGGTIERPPESIGAAGRFARFRDPEGNLWGLWQAKT